MQGDSFNVDIYIDDVADKTTKKTVLVTLDADFTAPVFTAAPDREMTVLLKANTTFNLKFDVEDNVALDYVMVDMEGIEGFPIRLEANGQKTLTFSRAIPLKSKVADYKLTVEAFDMAPQEGEVHNTKIESVVKVSELPDFDVLYLCDVATAADLNAYVFGVPVAMDHIAPVFRPEDQWDAENPMNNYQRSYNNQEWNPVANMARMDNKTRKFQLLANPFIEIRYAGMAQQRQDPLGLGPCG